MQLRKITLYQPAFLFMAIFVCLNSTKSIDKGHWKPAALSANEEL